MKVLLAWKGPRDARERVMYSRRQVPLLRQLAADGVQPILALLGDPGGMRHDLEGSGIAVAVLPILPPPTSALAALPRAVAALRALIAQHAPDVIDASDPLPGLAAALAARGPRRPGRPVVIYRRHFYRGRLRVRLSSQLAARLADRMVASCDAMRRRVADAERLPLQRVDVSTSGIVEPPLITAHDIASARRSLGIADDAFVVGAVAYLYQHKGIDVLIHALDHLRGASDVHLVVLGNGPEVPSLHELARRAPFPVHFLGHRDDVHLWIAASDVVAMPSRWECFGRVTLETMSVGRPLIASRVGGLEEAVVDGETGLLIPADDVTALAAALDTLRLDRALASRMGAAARARFESHYTIAHMAKSWRQAWARAVASGHGLAAEP